MITYSLKRVSQLILAHIILLVMVTSSPGASVDLVVLESNKTMPDGVVVPMWGYFTDSGQLCTDNPEWTVGPQIVVPPGDPMLQINLRNCLDDATSVVVTGLGLPTDGGGVLHAPVTFSYPDDPRVRVRSFTAETASGATVGYYWNNVEPGTYLYKSGTHPAKQVQMGLYGALTVDSALGAAYDGISYDQEVVLLYSEVDPELHNTLSSAKPLTYRPKYFLVNGSPFNGELPQPIGGIGQTTLLRFLNSGLKDHAPSISSGYLQIVAEDGNVYPYPLQQYSMNLAAGKTMDALLIPDTTGTYTIFDRSLHLTSNGMTDGGLVARLSVGDLAGVPTADAGPDQTFVAVGLPVILDGSASSDIDGEPLTYLWSVESAPGGSTAVLSDATAVAPTFTPDVAGSYLFQLVVNDGLFDSAPDSVSISTNLPPVAAAGGDTTVSVGDLVQLDGSGSFDPDNNLGTLSFSWTLTSVPAGSTAALNDPTITAPSFIADLAGDYVAGLTVNDGMADSDADNVVVTATVVVANDAPLALDDVATTVRNTDSDPIDVLANDSDADGTLDPTTVVIVNPPTRGGTAVVNADGTITFSPRRGFRGTDTFTYTVDDDLGATSNEATVRVNVVR